VASISTIVVGVGGGDIGRGNDELRNDFSVELSPSASTYSFSESLFDNSR
jgi:hypothetical protein